MTPTLQRGSLRSFLRAVLMLSALPCAAAPLALEPEAACQLLKAEGLQARGGYLEASKGYFRCSSYRKAVVSGGPVPHQILFFADGDASFVHSLGLELDIRSLDDVQRTLRRFADTADRLAEFSLGSTLAPEIRDAILAATGGHWEQQGQQIRLRRETRSSFAYRLTLRID